MKFKQSQIKSNFPERKVQHIFPQSINMLQSDKNVTSARIFFLIIILYLMYVLYVR